MGAQRQQRRWLYSGRRVLPDCKPSGAMYLDAWNQPGVDGMINIAIVESRTNYNTRELYLIYQFRRLIVHNGRSPGAHCRFAIGVSVDSQHSKEAMYFAFNLRFWLEGCHMLPSSYYNAHMCKAESEFSILGLHPASPTVTDCCWLSLESFPRFAGVT